MIKEAIGKVVTGEDLTEAEMAAAMEEMMAGSATEAQIGAFITAMRMKGETVDEITGAARVMRNRAIKVRLNNHAVIPIQSYQLPVFCYVGPSSKSRRQKKPIPGAFPDMGQQRTLIESPSGRW